MTWIANIRRHLAARALAGRGHLVLVVGPSGAGKDTLIAMASNLCRDDTNIVFPRRIVTRPRSDAEDHRTVSATDFEQQRATDGFALWWQAHGLSYALPRSIDRDIDAGRTVVCNVSRTVIAAARERYARVSAVLVTAPVDILARRLTQRGRETAGSIAARLQRGDALDAIPQADFVIENVGAPDIGAKQLRDIIYGRTDVVMISL